MSQIRSLFLVAMKFLITVLAVSMRLGWISSASIESDISNTTMISWETGFRLVIVRVIVPPTRIMSNVVIKRTLMIQSIHICLGVLRCFAMILFGYRTQNFSRKKIYQILIIIGTRMKIIGYENEIIVYIYSFRRSSVLIDSFKYGSVFFPENSICSNCSMMVMSSVSVV